MVRVIISIQEGSYHKFPTLTREVMIGSKAIKYNLVCVCVCVNVCVCVCCVCVCVNVCVGVCANAGHVLTAADK